MYDVTIDRNLFIGGSDIPIIMGISPFKSRFDLLLEKAGYLENGFKGNEYTEYGNILEPKIRDFINETEKDKYNEDKIIKDDLRYHSDGFNGKSVLEIKTTSQMKENVDDYKIYLVQLLIGMQIHGVKKGKLAVYERPKDFNKDFDESKLKVYEIDIKNYKELVEDINLAIEQFRVDLAKVKENPLITEEDLQPRELIELSNEVVKLELDLLKFDETAKRRDKLKSQLKIAMQKYGVKKWITPNNTKITLVADGEEKQVEVFNEDNFKKENEELYKKYSEKQIKKGKTGYVKITLER